MTPRENTSPTKKCVWSGALIRESTDVLFRDAVTTQLNAIDTLASGGDVIDIRIPVTPIIDGTDFVGYIFWCSTIDESTS